MEAGVTQGGDGLDSFGRLVVKRQKLVEVRDALISQIQGRPGLKDIMSGPSCIIPHWHSPLRRFSWPRHYNKSLRVAL